MVVKILTVVVVVVGAIINSLCIISGRISKEERERGNE